jgi:hypothetical protein
MSHYERQRNQPQAHLSQQHPPSFPSTTTTSQHFAQAAPRNILAQQPCPRTNHAQHQSQLQSHRRQPVANLVSRHQPVQSDISAVAHILPFCTTEPPLRQEDVIALSDVAGSLKELVLLALGAARGDGVSVRRLEGTVGRGVAEGVVEFFAEEWEVE